MWPASRLQGHRPAPLPQRTQPDVPECGKGPGDFSVLSIGWSQARDLVTPRIPPGGVPLTPEWGLGEPWEAALIVHSSVAGRWQEAVGNLISVPGGRAK